MGAAFCRRRHTAVVGEGNESMLQEGQPAVADMTHLVNTSWWPGYSSASIRITLRRVSGDYEYIDIMPDAAISDLRSELQKSVTDFQLVKLCVDSRELHDGTLRQAGLVAGAEINIVVARNVAKAIAQIRSYWHNSHDRDREKAFEAIKVIDNGPGSLEEAHCEALLQIISTKGPYYSCVCQSEFYLQVGMALGSSCHDPATCAISLLNIPVYEQGYCQGAVLGALREIYFRDNHIMTGHIVQLANIARACLGLHSSFQSWTSCGVGMLGLLGSLNDLAYLEEEKARCMEDELPDFANAAAVAIAQIRSRYFD